jgi:hypothetical protein
VKQEWLIEEELIEWLDKAGDVSKRGREIRLINPKGEIVGRRLALDGITEHYLLFQDNRCYNWFYPSDKPIAFFAQIPAEVQRFWMGRSLMTYRSDRHFNLYANYIWRLIERDPVSQVKFCAHRDCSRRMVEKYHYLSRLGLDGGSVEWRVSFRCEPPLLGREVPVCSEMWWDGQLRRRHALLHYRVATPEERAFFRIPRKSKLYRMELEQLFSPLSEYVPLLLSGS